MSESEKQDWPADTVHVDAITLLHDATCVPHSLQAWLMLCWTVCPWWPSRARCVEGCVAQALNTQATTVCVIAFPTLRLSRPVYCVVPVLLLASAARNLRSECVCMLHAPMMPMCTPYRSLGA